MAVFPEHSLLPRGTGPAAKVYMTPPPSGGQAGAIKVYPGPLDRPSVVDHLDEQRALAGLRNVSSILLIDEIEELPDERAAIRMELCAQSLAELVEVSGPLPPSEAVGLAETIAGVLVDAHNAGIVHGGVTPTNVLYRRAGQPVLADFGLGLRQSFPRAPEAAAAYTAPEVLRGAEPAEPADLYGLGAVLYLALTGGAPFSPRPGEPAEEVLLRALGEAPPAPGGDLPAGLSDLVTALLGKDPAARPSGAAEVLDQLPKLDTSASSRTAFGPPAGRTAPSEAPAPTPPVPAPSTSPAEPAEPAEPAQPAPPTSSEAHPLSPPPLPSPPSPEGAHDGATMESPPPPPDNRSGRADHRGGRSGNRWHTRPLLLTVPAVLAVLAVLFGVLGGGESGGRTPDNASASDRDSQQPAPRSASDAGGGAPESDGEKKDASQSDEPAGQRSGTPNSASPSTEPSAPPSVNLEIHRVRDHGSTVDLTWRSSKPLTYAVFVAKEGGDSASTKYRGTGTKLTVRLQPEVKYCFQVQGTDGTSTFESPPRGIRGATCQS